MVDFPMLRSKLVLLVVLFAAVFRLVALNRPFEYDDEGTGSFYGILARNYLRFGLQTHGVPVLAQNLIPCRSSNV